jgi:two-component system OmpR family response regulator
VSVKVLVVDDEVRLAQSVARGLRAEDFTVDVAHDGISGRDAAMSGAYDAIVLDIMLPGLQGYRVLEELRAAEVQTPILMLTAKDGEYDEADAFDLGADDYLTKPFSPRTLLARVRALLRRAGEEKPMPLAAGAFTLDLELQSVAVRGGDPVRLTRLELRLLQILLANAGHTLPAERLLSHVWGSRGSGDRQLLKQLVHRLRQKIEAEATEPRYLVTVSGVGYALRPEGEE